MFCFKILRSMILQHGQPLVGFVAFFALRPPPLLKIGVIL